MAVDAQPLALMSPVFPSPQLQLLLLHPINARKVQFFVGTVKSSNDLRRVKAVDAMAVFIFADAHVVEVSPPLTSWNCIACIACIGYCILMKMRRYLMCVMMF